MVACVAYNRIILGVDDIIKLILGKLINSLK